MLRHLMTSQNLTCRILKFDFLENEESFSSEIKNIFPIWQVLSFRLKSKLPKM